MDIAEVARRSGVPASALRHYERKGLIRSVGRAGLRRVFPELVLERLELIALGQAAGFSLDEMAAMLGDTDTPHIDRDLLAAKALSLESTIKRLQALHDGLAHAAVCRAPHHLECPSFRRLMGWAGKHQRERQQKGRLTPGAPNGPRRNRRSPD
ncbi:MerR family transcriptional regulator [Ahniella affigens]|uniref:MerR family transcriptional regulator n=1 Tax=Ahniella affigens TaxID=2021234 RepID=A0A2P1PN44_9GAMM|nr:helix-turn-helix domain-containing protein [Ahniella affigens]AVP96273.1 MerR family transcriptional regulator [Ahniella affigens]